MDTFFKNVRERRAFSHEGRQFAAGEQTVKNSKSTNRNLKNNPPKGITKGHFLNRNNTKAHWDEIILPTQVCVNTKTLFLGFLNDGWWLLPMECLCLPKYHRLTWPTNEATTENSVYRNKLANISKKQNYKIQVHKQRKGKKINKWWIANKLNIG